MWHIFNDDGASDEDTSPSDEPIPATAETTQQKSAVHGPVMSSL